MPTRCIDPCTYVGIDDTLQCCFKGSRDFGNKEWSCVTKDGARIDVDPFPDQQAITTDILRTKYKNLTLTEFCHRVSTALGGDSLRGNPAIKPFEYW